VFCDKIHRTHIVVMRIVEGIAVPRRSLVIGSIESIPYLSFTIY
jgi:hypothetical protein